MRSHSHGSPVQLLFPAEGVPDLGLLEKKEYGVLEEEEATTVFLRIYRGVRLLQAKMERKMVLRILDLKFLRPRKIFLASRILTTSIATERALI